MTLGFLVGSKNFWKLFTVSWEVHVLHGYDCIHCVAKSCTTITYRWLSRDSHPSPRTSWSAVAGSPKISALGTTVPARLLRETLVIFVLKHKNQFRSFGKWVKMWLLLAAPKVIHEKNWKCLDVLEHFHQPVHAWTPVANPAHLATHHSVILRRRHFYLVFRFLLIHATSFFVLMSPRSSFHFYLLLEFSVSVTVSCDEDVGEVDEDEVQELVDKPTTTKGT